VGSGSALLVAAVAAVHPALITYSCKAKVFSLESFTTVALLWAGFEACRRPSSRSLLLFMAVGLLGLGFTFTSSLLIAGWIPLLAYAVLVNRLPNRSDDTADRPVRTLFVVAAVLTLAGAAWYLWLAGSPNREVMVKYQEAAFRAWPEAYTPGALGTWLLFKSYGVLRFVLGMSEVWAPLKWCIGTAGLLAVSASAGVLWRRCRVACLFAVILAVEVVMAGALRLWPMGEHQTTTFLIPLFAIAMGCGLHEFARRMGRSPVTAVVLALCVFVPAARATKATLFPPPLEQHTRPVFAYTAARLQPDDAIFIHYEMRDAYGFYWRGAGHPTLLQPHGNRDDLTAFAGQFDAWIAEHRRVWFVFMLRRPNEVGPWMGHLKEHYHIRDEYRFNDAATYLIER